MTDLDPAGRSRWTWESGEIDKGMLASQREDAMSPISYVVRVPGLLTGMEEMRCEAGFDDDGIRTKDFSDAGENLKTRITNWKIACSKKKGG